MTPAALIASLNEVCAKLVTLGIALDANNHKIESLNRDDTLFDRVTWATYGAGTLTDYPLGSLSEYFKIMRMREFSVVLRDGSAMQISYDFSRRNDIIAHRLCYVPCPVNISLDRLDEIPVEDQVRESLELLDCADSRITDAMLFRPYLRFDFDVSQQDEVHSPSHCHLAFPECRIPVKSPMSPRHFFSFVLQRLYGLSEIEWLHEECAHEEFNESICDRDSKRMHFSWRRPA